MSPLPYTPCTVLQIHVSRLTLILYAYVSPFFCRLESPSLYIYISISIYPYIYTYIYIYIYVYIYIYTHVFYIFVIPCHTERTVQRYATLRSLSRYPKPEDAKFINALNLEQVDFHNVQRFFLRFTAKYGVR